ncbi:GTP-binding protein [Microbacterium sp. cx-59]|uniref:GTP-binding protein n=1 Tax=Microbacterium sp. cx-59 TaxID=2891207 RepID=UPI001E432FA9|nr:GTP-binding protein [Microbacterium sp. cx-59]MCC4909076.1 GTP-binding protein [Microbacterium sp. cx-59]
MESGPIVIVGVCTPERRRYVSRAAAALSLRVAHAAGGRGRTASLPTNPHIGGADAQRGMLIDAATDIELEHFLVSPREFVDVVCVVDAVHMLGDLRDDVPLMEHAPAGDDRGDHGSRARQAASFIEAASLVAFVNWEEVETARLAVLMALASHLNPTARIRLSRHPADDVRSIAAAAPTETPWQMRAGWVQALNSEHEPFMTDRRVQTFRYEQLRAFHPGRLREVLDDDIDSGRMGRVLRSVGFCRLATRPNILGRWEQVGSAMWIDPLAEDDGLHTVGQEIVFTGLDMHPRRLHDALDRAALTDAELAGGPAMWRRFADPLPPWPVDTSRTDH